MTDAAARPVRTAPGLLPLAHSASGCRAQPLNAAASPHVVPPKPLVELAKTAIAQRVLSAKPNHPVGLSRSTLRASIAVAQLGVTRAYARQRPSVMTEAEVAQVNEWLTGCELGWHECVTALAAHELEVRLRGEWTPPLNIL